MSENKTRDTPADRAFLTVIFFFVAGTVSFLIFFAITAPVFFNNPFTIDSTKIETIKEECETVRPDGKTSIDISVLRVHFKNGKVCDVHIWATLVSFSMALVLYLLTFQSYKEYRHIRKLQNQNSQDGGST